MYRPRLGDVLVSKSSARADRYSIGVIDDAEQAVARRFDEFEKANLVASLSHRSKRSTRD